jgi:hypothetical protein
MSGSFAAKSAEQEAEERREKRLAEIAMERRVHGVDDSYTGVYMRVIPGVNNATGKALPTFIVLVNDKTPDEIAAEIFDGLNRPEAPAYNMVDTIELHGARGTMFMHRLQYGWGDQSFADIEASAREILKRAEEDNVLIPRIGLATQSAEEAPKRQVA